MTDVPDCHTAVTLMLLFPRIGNASTESVAAASHRYCSIMTIDALKSSPVSRAAHSETQRSQSLSRWLREPLVHFLALGALIFLLNDVISPAVPPEKKIDLTPSARQTMIEAFTRDRGRAPNDAETKELVDNWVLNEVTYREALAQGFDKGDDMIRDRVMQKMRLLIFSNVSVPKPTPAQLQHWLDTHRARYDVPKRVSFFEVPMGDSEADTNSMLKLIAAEKEPESVRLRAHTFVDRPIDSLIGGFSQEFIDRLQMLPPHQWDMLKSTDGWHLVRLENVVPARKVSVEEVRDPLTTDWQQEEARTQAVSVVRNMGKNYVVGGLARP